MPNLKDININEHIYLRKYNISRYMYFTTMYIIIIIYIFKIITYFTITIKSFICMLQSDTCIFAIRYIKIGKRRE